MMAKRAELMLDLPDDSTADWEIVRMLRMAADAVNEGEASGEDGATLYDDDGVQRGSVRVFSAG